MVFEKFVMHEFCKMVTLLLCTVGPSHPPLHFDFVENHRTLCVHTYRANLSVSLYFPPERVSMQQDLFNDYVVHAEEEIPEDSRAMICDCPPECDYYVYNTRYSNVPLHAMNDVVLDVHFIGQTTFRYKTDIVITQLDLLGILLSTCFKTAFVMHFYVPSSYKVSLSYASTMRANK